MLAVKPASEYRPWPPASGLPALHISHDAARDLAARVFDGVNALPRRGLEIGGLLIGSVRENTIYVDSLLPINSRYPSGPVFVVEDDDALEAVEAAAKVGVIVGLYRSRTDEIIEIDPPFEYMLQSVARSHVAAFVLIAQSRNTKPVARAGVRLSNGTFQWLGESFPLTPWLHGSVSAAPAPTPPVPPPASVRAEPPLFVDEDRPWERKPKSWIPWAVGAGLACAGMAIVSMRTTLPPDVEPSRQNASASSTAERPALATRSRAVEEVVEPAPEPVRPQPGAALTATVRPEPKPAKPMAVAPAESRVLAIRKFTAPPQPERRAALPARVPDPGTSSVVRIPSVGGGVVPAGLWQSQPTAALPPAPASVALQFTPPVLARQARPVVIPPDLRRLLDTEVVLAARVSVDERGRVTRAVPLETMDRVQQSIWHFYSAAIGLWEFEPALQNGKPVAGETILRFRVQPSR